MNRIHAMLNPRIRSGTRIVALSLAFLAGSMFCSAQTPAPTQPAVPGKSKPLPQWSPADWKAYGTSVGNDPAAQKLSPLDRAKYVADKVGQQYDAAGISPNNWYFGKGRQGLGGEAPGTCGDLTVNMEAALEGAGFQTGNVEVEQSGVGYYNPFNVNRNHGAPIVRVDGKEYVFDMWYHSGSEGKFSGFKDSAFAMPLDDWKALMTDEGYKVSTYAPPPPPPPTSKKSDAETPGTEAEPPPGPADASSSDESTGQAPEPATSTPDSGSQADAPPGGTETDGTAAEGTDEDSSEDGDEAAGETDDTAAGNDDSDEEATDDSEDETSEPDDADTKDGDPEDDGDAADKPETGDADDSADDDGESDADDSGDDESGADESGEDPSEGASDAEPSESDADSNAGGAPGDTTVGYVQNSEGRITVTETRGSDGSLIRITETETDSSGNVKGTTTYEGGTGEGKYTPGGGLKDAEPPPDGAVSPENVAGGVNTSGDFAQNWSQSQNQRGAEGSLTMANNAQMNEAANVGNQSLADAASVRDSGGRDSQATRDAASRASAKSDRDNSWGKAIGDALESGVTEGGKAFGAALGGAAADQAVGEIFGSDEPDSGADSASDGASAAAPGNSPTSGGTSRGNRKGDRDDDDDEEDGGDSNSSSSSGSSSGGSSDGSSSSSSSDDPLGVTGTTKNDDGTVTIRYGCGYSWSGTPPGPSRCPICSRETVSTETSPASGSDAPPPEDPADSDDEPVYEPPFEPEEPSMDPPEDDGPITYEGWSS